MVLVLRALGIGDLATAVPALRGLRAGTGDRITFAAPAWLAPLIRLTGAVDEHLPVPDLASVLPDHPALPDQPVLAGVPASAGTLAVNLHGRGPQSHRLLRSAWPARLWAFACPAAGYRDGPAWEPDEHEVERWCRMLRHYGLDPDPDDLDLRTPPEVDRVPAGVTIVHPGAKAARRRWPPDRYAEVARRLTSEGLRVVVTGSESERGLASRVAQRAGLGPEAVLAGRLDLAELAALVARARLVISGDTGVAHLATGYRTGSVVLFGPVSPAHWGPPPDRLRHRVLWHPEALAGIVPDPGAPHPALGAISVAEVLAAAQSVLDRSGW